VPPSQTTSTRRGSRPRRPAHLTVVLVLAPPSKARLAHARRLDRRAFRDSAGEFLAEGPQTVGEAVTAGAVREVFLAASVAQRHEDLARRAIAAGARVYDTPDDVVASLSTTSTPQGVVAVCGVMDVSLDSVLAAGPRLVGVLAAVRDPGNAGTIVRTADAAGADAVVLGTESVDVYNPKCVRATTGSLFHLAVVIGAPVGDVVASARAAGLRVLAADGAGDADLDDEAASGRLSVPTAWVFGNEAWGLPAELRELADAVVRVPIHGRAESLNLAAAAAVCLYASARAQRAGGAQQRPD
jgi:TrmH family RNA methyltransferase